MTDAPRILLTVRTDGSATAVTEGMQGEACLDYIAVLEDLIGGTTSQSAFTDDYTRVAARDELEDPLAHEVTDR